MPPDANDPLDGWGQYRRLILSQLDTITADIREITKKIEQFRAEDISQIKTDIALLKFRAAMYGALAASAISIIVSVVLHFWK
jgi:hypothetical protein